MSACVWIRNLCSSIHVLCLLLFHSVRSSVFIDSNFRFVISAFFFKWFLCIPTMRIEIRNSIEMVHWLATSTKSAVYHRECERERNAARTAAASRNFAVWFFIFLFLFERLGNVHFLPSHSSGCDGGGGSKNCGASMWKRASVSNGIDISVWMCIKQS